MALWSGSNRPCKTGKPCFESHAVTLYLLDTNICIFTMNQRPLWVGQKLQQATESGHTIGISSVTLHELWYGVQRSTRLEANSKRLETLITELALFHFEAEAAKRAAEARATLSKNGQPIGPFDVLIAGHALALDAVLVTNNMREFERIEDLKLEDWATQT